MAVSVPAAAMIGLDVSQVQPTTFPWAEILGVKLLQKGIRSLGSVGYGASSNSGPGRTWAQVASANYGGMTLDFQPPASNCPVQLSADDVF